MIIKAEDKFNLTGRGTVFTSIVEEGAFNYILHQNKEKNDIFIEWKGKILICKVIGVEHFRYSMPRPKYPKNIGINVKVLKELGKDTE